MPKGVYDHSIIDYGKRKKADGYKWHKTQDPVIFTQPELVQIMIDWVANKTDYGEVDVDLMLTVVGVLSKLVHGNYPNKEVSVDEITSRINSEIPSFSKSVFY